MPSPLIAPSANWACILHIMSFTPRHRGLHPSSEGQPSCLSDRSGLETRRRQKHQKTGSPATPTLWEEQSKGHTERQRGSEWKTEVERQRETAEGMRENHSERGRCPWARLALSCLGPSPRTRDRDGAATLHQPYVVFIAAGPANTICDLHPSGGILEFNNGRLCREGAWARPWRATSSSIISLFIYCVECVFSGNSTIKWLLFIITNLFII